MRLLHSSRVPDRVRGKLHFARSDRPDPLSVLPGRQASGQDHPGGSAGASLAALHQDQRDMEHPGGSVHSRRRRCGGKDDTERDRRRRWGRWRRRHQRAELHRAGRLCRRADGSAQLRGPAGPECAPGLLPKGGRVRDRRGPAAPVQRRGRHRIPGASWTHARGCARLRRGGMS